MHHLDLSTNALGTANNLEVSSINSARLWNISENTFDPKKLHVGETIYTTGNGYFATRGTFEEGYPGANPATLLYGVFDAIPTGKEELANVPDWLPIKLSVNGERFRLDTGKLLEFYRTLNLHTGVLSRRVGWESPSGLRLLVEFERFASLADEHLGVIRCSVTTEGYARGQQARRGEADLEVELWAGFNGAVGNYDLMHWRPLDQQHEDGLLWLQSQTRHRHSPIQLVQTMSFTTQTLDLCKEFIDSDIAPGIRFRGKLAIGQRITAEKIVVMYTSHDVINPLQAARMHHRTLMEGSTVTDQLNGHHSPSSDAHLCTDRQSSPGLSRLSRGQQILLQNATPSERETQTESNGHCTPSPALLRQHKEAWRCYWDLSDIIIEGDDKAQQAIRYNIYQLRISVSSHDSRSSIAAKGLTGFGYRGHVFHDTEIFMLPYFTYVHPQIARTLLLYRHRLLPAARTKAACNGYQGAQFPWESTLDGEEATPLYLIAENGEVLLIRNGFIELHITASIAHAAWHYWFVTEDNEFMRNYGAELLLHTAAFWISRATYSSERHGYEINGVMGPDEWHEPVNNNAYTNYMAKHNIQTALEILHWLQSTAPEKAKELTQQLDLNQTRLEHWRDVIARLCIPYDEHTHLFEQFEGFFKLEPLDQDKFQGRNTSYQGLLGVKELGRYQIIKQADVLMLLTVLDQQFDLETKRANWEYYHPITDHDYGSSLTPAFHAILACELGQVDTAYKLFLKGALADLEDLRGNTAEGIHTACCGAVWQAVVLGFAGLQLTKEGYRVKPSWPEGWRRLAFTFMHKGQPVFMDLRREVSYEYALRNG